MSLEWDPEIRVAPVEENSVLDKFGDFNKCTPLWQPILCCNLLFAYVLLQQDQHLLKLKAEPLLFIQK